MCNMFGKNFFSISFGMDINYSDVNGLRGIFNGYLKISIISLKRKFKKRLEKWKYRVGLNFYFKYFIVFYNVIFIFFLSMLKILLFFLFK